MQGGATVKQQRLFPARRTVLAFRHSRMLGEAVEGEHSLSDVDERVTNRMSVPHSRLRRVAVLQKCIWRL